MATARNLSHERERMVRHQLEGRGLADRRVLDAMGKVPREAFVPPQLAEFAYQDTPLPIAEQQTISQPYIVALMIEAAEIEPGDRVLEVGTGSGYAAGVMAQIADRVVSIERHPRLVKDATTAMRTAGIDNVAVIEGDGSLGYPGEAPYDVILVAAGAPEVPESLKRQLAVGGRLVIPVGQQMQSLFRIRRTGQDSFERENLGPVRFVPLIGREGWENRDAQASAYAGNLAEPKPQAAPEVLSEEALVSAMAQAAEPLPEVGGAGFAEAFDRLGDAKVVCLGEASHGTREFYRARAEITKRLIEEHGVTLVTLEADWPDAARVDRYVRHRDSAPWDEPAFRRFPQWMWRNEEFAEFVDWLRAWNADKDPGERVSVHGLDLYALYASAAAVVSFLERVDPEAAEVARTRYGCLEPWQKDPVTYGRAALTRSFEECEESVVAMLRELLDKRVRYAESDRDDYLEAEGNARLVAAAEDYYRTLFYAEADSWNRRDSHMFATLARLRQARQAPGGGARKAVVWAHNSHLGDAAATEMGIARGEHNLGQLCREAWGSDVALVGFGTDHGTVAAATDWDGPVEFKSVRPALDGSVEALSRATGHPRFLLDLGKQAGTSLAHSLLGPRLQRAIGVIYRPQTERMSHYFEVSLPRQFDHWVWFDRTEAVTPLEVETRLEGKAEMPDTWPFAV
jgi:protein-L-isoaspartate(D-aspartate) O-methyltransferase